MFLFADYLKDIVRNCGHVTYKKDEMIIKQGDIGDWLVYIRVFGMLVIISSNLHEAHYVYLLIF